MSADKTEAEREIRQAFDAQDFQRAATLALEAYGQEILSFLGARLRAPSDAEEAFSIFAEDLWKGLPGFGFRCSMRGWLYALARNAANRHATAPQRRAGRNLTLSGQVSRVIDQSRSATQMHRRTDVKDKIRALREQLPGDDQTLLILHVDRNLPWREIALALQDDGAALDDEALDREAARLRKRFERVKTELKDMALQAGLIKS